MNLIFLFPDKSSIERRLSALCYSASAMWAAAGLSADQWWDVKGCVCEYSLDSVAPSPGNCSFLPGDYQRASSHFKKEKQFKNYIFVGNLPYQRCYPFPFFVAAEARVFHLALTLNLVNKCTLELELSVQLCLRIIKNETKWVALHSVHQSNVWNSTCLLRDKSEKTYISSRQFDTWVSLSKSEHASLTSSGRDSLRSSERWLLEEIVKSSIWSNMDTR